MHPAGIKFGLTHNMLQLRGSDVVLSDKLLEYMSSAARRQLSRKRIDGGGLLDDVITRGLRKMKLLIHNPNRGESTSFYTKVEEITFATMYPYAEAAGIGYRQGRTFFFTREFAAELFERKKVLRRAAEEYGYEKVLFLACYDAVIARCKRVIPEHDRHADLLALCMFKVYDAIIMNNFMERFGTR
jgi:hypothetical protein